MGFLNLFRGRKTEQNAETPAAHSGSVELDAADITGWINQNYSKEIENEKKEFSRMSTDVMESANELRKFVEKIRKGNFQEGDKTYAAINMIKDTWAKKAILCTSSYERDIDFSSVQEGSIDFPLFRDIFHRTIKLMDETGMIPKQRMVMGRFFEKESAKLADIFGSMGKKLDVMKESINGRSALKDMSSVGKLSEDLSQLSGDLDNLNSRKEEHLANFEDAKKKLSQTERHLVALVKGQDWKELEDTEKAYEDCKKEIDAIENGIIGKLGDIKRLMKLFAHDCEKIDKNEKGLAERFSESPVKTFFESGPGDLQELFKKVLFKEKSEEFKVSDKDKSKMKTLTGIVESGWLAMKMAEYEGKKDMCSDYKKKLGGISVHMEKRETERTIEKAKSDVTGFERDIVSIEEKIAGKEKETEQKRNEIRAYTEKEMKITVVMK